MVPSLEGLAPFQIAFVVRDLERAVREFDARFGAGPSETLTFKRVSHVWFTACTTVK